VSSGGKILASYLPYANPNPPFTGDFDNYTSGLRVPLRYLAYAYQASPPIAQIVNAPDYRTAIINDRLIASFGIHAVFRDVDAIKPGTKLMRP
jgi:hypothetical protein